MCFVLFYIIHLRSPGALKQTNDIPLYRALDIPTYSDSWGNSAPEAFFLCKNTSLKIDLTSARPPKNISLNDVIGRDDHDYRYLRSKQRMKEVSYNALGTFHYICYSGLLWPDLDFDLPYDTVTLLGILEYFGWVLAQYFISNHPGAIQNKNAAFTFDLTLNLTPTLTKKIWYVSALDASRRERSNAGS